ncbi:hypothetical protein ACF3NT_06025 [Naumannella halotolerans]|uniref:hypothetical protein n=1 Tax=Naumannella halotolerans TaxID=993414 RepID=UPI001FBAC18F|nr:hypothetical protein [Naumannella halotolerans]
MTKRAIDAIRTLARTEGILAGGSSGVALAAAFELAAELTAQDVLVVVLPDSGRSYLSTYFDDDWLAAAGFDAGAGEPTDDAPTVGGQATPITWLDAEERVGAAQQQLLARPGSVGLLVHRRAHRDLPPHPSEVIGAVSAHRLSGLGGDLPAALVSEPVTRRAGVGERSARTAARLAGFDGPDRWALVLDQGRVVAVPALERLNDAQKETTHG